MTGRHRHPTPPAAGRRGALPPRTVAAVQLLTVILAPPALLLTLIGNPLDPPPALRSAQVLTDAVDDRSLLWLLALTAWLLYGHLLATLLIETFRQVRGSNLPLPLPRLLFGANAALASHLIAGLLLVPGSGLGAGSHSGKGLTPAVVRAAMTVPISASAMPPARDRPPTLAVPPSSSAAAAAADSTPAETRAGHIHCRVLPPEGRDHDTLWDIAERHLGDGTRWRDVYALNQGRLMPDGQRLTRASLIHPGWILQLPADAIALDIDSVPPPLTPQPQPNAGSAEPAPSEAARPAPDSADSSTDASQHGEPPPQPTAGSTAPLVPHDMAAPSGRAEPSDTHQRPEQAAEQKPAKAGDDDSDALMPTVALGLLGLASIGLLKTLTNRHRIAARRRPLGVRTSPPSGALRDLEAQLRQQARVAEDTAAAVQLAVQLASRRAPDTTLRALWQHPDGSLELVLAQPHPNEPAPAPFSTTDVGWLLSASDLRFLYPIKQGGLDTHDRDVPMRAEPTDKPDPVPMLVPVGTRDGSVCLVNLELAGLVSLSYNDLPHQEELAARPSLAHTASQTGTTTSGVFGGETAAGEQASAGQVSPPTVIAAWIQALQSAPWSDLVRTYVPVSLGPVTTGFDRLTTADPLAEDGAYTMGELSPDEQQAVQANGTVAQARRTDARAELVSLSLWAGYTADQLPDRLLAAAADPQEPNVVLLNDQHPAAQAWHLTGSGHLDIPGIGDRIQPLTLAPDQHEMVLRLLEHAEDPPHAPADARERAQLLADCPAVDPTPPATPPATAPAHSASPTPPWSVGPPTGTVDLTSADRHDTADPAAPVPDAGSQDYAARPEPAVPVDGLTGANDIAQPASLELPQHLEVGVLGPLQVHGAHGHPPRRQCLEALVYLALHRRPVPVHALWQAVYPGRPYDSHQLVNRMSELRRYARQKLPQINKSYQLDEFARTDWQRFQALAKGNPAQQLEALALVRGRPFEDIRLDWPHLEGQLAEIEASIVDLAVTVGERALRSRDPDTARTAALAGLRGCPWDERLYRIAMQAAAARGATQELHQLRTQLQRVLDDELDGDDDMQPATQQLDSTLRDEEQRRRRVAERRRNGG